MPCALNGTKGTQNKDALSLFLYKQELALDAVETVKVVPEVGQTEIDVKNYAKVEKISGGAIEDSRVLKGVMFNKDVVVPGRMRRKIQNPRILLLDCPLEYKKGENQTNVEITKEEDWAALLKAEEEQIQKMCDQIIAFKPDVVVTEKVGSARGLLCPSITQACHSDAT